MANDKAVAATGSAVAAPDRSPDPTLPGDDAMFQHVASRDADAGWDASPRGAPPRGDRGKTPSQTGGMQRSNSSSATRNVNAGSGRPFNWRDYIKVEHSTYYLDEKGQPTDRILRQPVEDQDRLKALALRQRENEQITERALDQLSRIPEFQASIRKAHTIFSAKAAADPELAKESGGRLRVSLSDGRTGFDPGAGTMNLNAQDVVSSRYMTADGPRPFSLQGVLVHELAGHGSDGSLTPGKDLNERKEALTKALDGLFRYYPDLKAEYDRSHTILGKPVGDLFSAPDYDTFDRKYKDLLDGSYIDFPRKDLEKHVVGQYPPDRRKYEVLSGALNILYKSELSDIVERLDEAPAIELTNKIMGKYYGEPPRVGYEVDRVRSRDPFDAPPPSLADITYPSIKVNPNKLAPRRLHAIQR